MMLLARPKAIGGNKKRHPTGRIKLNRNHWLAPYLTFFAPMTQPSSEVVDLISGKSVALGSGVSWINHPTYGWMLEWDGTTTSSTEMNFDNSITYGIYTGVFYNNYISDTSGWFGTAQYITAGNGYFTYSHASNFYYIDGPKITFAIANAFAGIHHGGVFGQSRSFADGYFLGESSGGAATFSDTGPVKLWSVPNADSPAVALNYLGFYTLPDVGNDSTLWDSEEFRLYETYQDLVLPETRTHFSIPFSVESSSTSSSSSGLDVIIADTIPIDINGTIVNVQVLKEANQAPVSINSSTVSPTLQIEVGNSSWVQIVSLDIVQPNLQLQLNQTPLTAVIDIIAPNTGQSLIVNADVLSITSSLVAPSLQKEYSQTPQDIISSSVAATLQIELSTTPVSTTVSVVSLAQQLEVNTTPVTLVTSILTQLIEHQIGANVIELIFSVVNVTTSHDISGGEITIVVSPEPIEPKNNLFAAFFERLKFINKQNIVSEFVLEETPLPYLSLGQIFNVLSWKNSCLERFEESNYRLSVYAENYDELAEKVSELEHHLIYNTILLNNPKQVISLDQVAKITQELIPQLYRTQLIYEVIVQKHISEVYIGSPTTGETLNKAIYERFKSLPLAGMVNDLVSPGYALENAEYPYLVVPIIRENLEWNHSLGRVDNVKYPLTVFSEDLIQLTEIMDEIEKSFDYCKFLISNKTHLINEWMGTDIVELQPQLWRGSVNYEVLVESSLESIKQ